MDRPPTVTVEDSLHEVLELLNRHEALVVRSPHGLQGIATQADLLGYFYKLARPYVLVQEIELAIRALIGHAAPGERLNECIDAAIRGYYENHLKRHPPTRLDEMTFDDYRKIITANTNWPLFQPIFGPNRDLVAGRLERIRDLRNAVFHFRTDLAIVDHQTLAARREWLHDKLRAVGVLQGEVQRA